MQELSARRDGQRRAVQAPLRTFSCLPEHYIGLSKINANGTLRLCVYVKGQVKLKEIPSLKREMVIRPLKIKNDK